MLMSKQCLKCRHVAEIEVGPTAECPNCGAIYAKMETLAQAARMPAATGAAPNLAPPPNQPTSPRLSPAEPKQAPPNAQAAPAAPKAEWTYSGNEFSQVLRSESIYPTFRGFIQVFYAIGLFFAACAVLGGLLRAYWSTGFLEGAGSLLLGLGLALFFFVMARLFKEASQMAADASDALVRLAARES